MDRFERNIKIYYWYATFTNLLILGPIITLFLLNKGLDYTQIMMLQSVAAITIVLMEVPTGAVADLISRKISVIIGSSCMVISILVYIYGKHFIIFALAEFLFSMGMSFKSGADTAMIYDTLKSLNKESMFKEVQGKGYSLALMAQIPGSIIAGYIYDINANLPMYVSIIFMIITIIITLMFYEINIYKYYEKPSYLNQIKESALYLKGHKKVKTIIIYTMFFYIFFRAGFWLYQPYLKAVSIPVKYFGYVFAGFNLVAAIFSRFSPIIIKKTRGKTLITLSILIMISLVLLGLTKIWIGLFLIFPQQMARGLYRPTIMKYINKHIPSNKRATIISFQSLLQNLSVAITLPLVGILMDNLDIFKVSLVLGIIMAIGVIFMFKFLDRSLGRIT